MLVVGKKLQRITLTQNSNSWLFREKRWLKATVLNLCACSFKFFLDLHVSKNFLCFLCRPTAFCDNPGSQEQSWCRIFRQDF